MGCRFQVPDSPLVIQLVADEHGKVVEGSPSVPLTRVGVLSGLSISNRGPRWPGPYGWGWSIQPVKQQMEPIHLSLSTFQINLREKKNNKGDFLIARMNGDQNKYCNMQKINKLILKNMQTEYP